MPKVCQRHRHLARYAVRHVQDDFHDRALTNGLVVAPNGGHAAIKARSDAHCVPRVQSASEIHSTGRSGLGITFIVRKGHPGAVVAEVI
jgi:hypothetical protein